MVVWCWGIKPELMGAWQAGRALLTNCSGDAMFKSTNSPPCPGCDLVLVLILEGECHHFPWEMASPRTWNSYSVKILYVKTHEPHISNDSYSKWPTAATLRSPEGSKDSAVPYNERWVRLHSWLTGKTFFRVIYFTVWVLCRRICLYITCVSGGHNSQKRALDCLELEL